MHHSPRAAGRREADVRLADRIAEAEAKLARLKREAATADCNDLGHDWASDGGCNAGCHRDCVCSVQVNTCRRCGDCDYGHNEDAARVRAECDRCDYAEGG